MSPRRHTRPAPSGVVREKALAAGARRWLDDLPELVEGLERDWSIRVGRRYHDSTEAFVARARLGDEYDLGVMMREDPVELMHGDPRERARWLARRTGLDESGCSGWWTGGSTGPGTTRSGRWRRSRLA